MKTYAAKKYANALELYHRKNYTDAYKIFTDLSNLAHSDQIDVVILSKMYQGYMMALGQGVKEYIYRDNCFYSILSRSITQDEFDIYDDRSHSYTIRPDLHHYYYLFLARIFVTYAYRHKAHYSPEMKNERSKNINKFCNLALRCLNKILFDSERQILIKMHNKAWSDASCLKAQIFSARMGYQPTEYVLNTKKLNRAMEKNSKSSSVQALLDTEKALSNEMFVHEMERWISLYNHSEYDQFKSAALLGLFRLGYDSMCKNKQMSSQIQTYICPINGHGDDVSQASQFYSKLDEDKFKDDINQFEWYQANWPKSEMTGSSKPRYTSKLFSEDKLDLKRKRYEYDTEEKIHSPHITTTKDSQDTDIKPLRLTR